MIIELLFAIVLFYSVKKKQIKCVFKLYFFRIRIHECYIRLLTSKCSSNCNRQSNRIHKIFLEISCLDHLDLSYGFRENPLIDFLDFLISKSILFIGTI